MLKLENVKKIYETKAGTVNALNGVSLVFPETGMVFITGKSGCGKTTMLNVIGGLDGIDSGDISVLGKSFSTFTPADYDNYRNTFIGFIFQEYNLLSEFTVEKNIKMAMELQGRVADEEEFNALLEKVDILDLKNRKPSELSGGQRQRVAIARALVKEPRIIMADEPTGALDSNTGVQVLETLKKLSKDKLVIVVSHDMELSEKYADRIIRLVDGEVLEDVTYSNSEVTANIQSTEESIIVRNGATLNDKEKDELADAVKCRKKIEVIENLTYREKSDTGEVKEVKADGEVKLKKSKMKLKSSVALGVKSLAVKPLRLIFTILLSAVAFAVFGLFDTIASFNSSRVVDNLLRTSTSPTVVASMKYVIDEKGGDEYSLKISDETLQKIAGETGYKIKGIYDFDYNAFGSTQVGYKINEFTTTTIREGTGYFVPNITGLIEFKKEEIKEGGYLGDFNFRVLYGKYPELRYHEGTTVATYESRHEIAISTYLAETLMRYIGEDTFHGESISHMEDLLGHTIGVNQRDYKIVGIIDCGAIPEKYEPLKTSTATREETRTLTADFSTYLASGAYNCMFVADGFYELYKKENSPAVYYYTGKSIWTVTTATDKRERNVNDVMYAVEDFDSENVFFFDESRYNDDGTIKPLADDEILIHPENFESAFLAKEIVGNSAPLDPNQKIAISALLRGIKSSDFSVEEKREDLQDILNIISEANGALLVNSIKEGRKIEVTQITDGARTETKRTLKVVGVYSVKDEYQPVVGTTYRFMANKNLIESCNGYTGQGDYSKIIFPSNGTIFGPSVIANYMSSDDGFALVWYGNSVLSTIKSNESTIKQAADLFLYIALVLAVFSMFMLFNYITTSIISKRQSIGVLRGLGSGGKDIFLMFISESLIIALFNGLFASIFAFVGCIFVNMYIINVMNISISFALFGVRQVLVIFGMSILTAVLSSALPISKIAKEKPVDLIRRP